MHSVHPRAPQKRHFSTETFSRGIIGKTDAHRVYYETINVRYTLVQSRNLRACQNFKNSIFLITAPYSNFVSQLCCYYQSTRCMHGPSENEIAYSSDCLFSTHPLALHVLGRKHWQSDLRLKRDHCPFLSKINPSHFRLGIPQIKFRWNVICGRKVKGFF